MGWTYSTQWPTRKAVIDHLLEPWMDGTRAIAHAAKRFARTLYVVWEKPDGTRFIGVYLVNADKQGGPTGGYKDMSESMGPTESECPVEFFDLVEDPGHDATAWRARCRANAEAHRTKLLAGTTVRFAAPLSFGDGVREDTFIVQRKGRSTRFHRTQDGVWCQITRWQRREYVIVAQAA